MSHYSVIVCTENPADIEARLAPYDENVEVCGDCEKGDDCQRTPECGNPQAKWDWWVVGGRWGGYFAYRAEHAASVIMPERQWSSPDLKPLHCDGGPKYALDFDVMRAEEMDKARKTYAEWEGLTAGTPDPLPWSVFTENISEGNGYTIQQAREEYHSQPRIKRLEGTDFQWYDDPVATFDIPEDLYVERARARAVPGWGILTLDGRWMEQGNMGWWGLNDATESSKIGYWEASNAYLEALPDDVFLICVDCHILGRKAVTTIVCAEQTCSACPSQWDAWDDYGNYWYLRYRNGRGSAERQSSPDPLSWEFPHKPEISFSYGHPLNGRISLEDFCREAGLELDLEDK